MKSFLLATRMEIIAPTTGGGVGIFALLVEWAPIISIAAALIGVALGVMSFIMKRQQHKMEMEYYAAKIKHMKSGNSK
ncbi:hypothetical protein [Carboxylicivirga marina]|uniref:LapA family protein n=1 Tax=Carboxylicivirga marina TaxID=2800988 RepID=A0ABS1HGE8_9BACT|nr:hypothetical protein [Carboxylicivirga marina]MBK3516719.1 hypothetical protein [Carboxylicivirga marina]